MLVIPDSPREAFVTRADIALIHMKSGAWSYAEANAAAIDADWARRVQEKPSLFNGRFFLVDHWWTINDSFEATAIESDYKSYLHWRAAGFPGKAWNAFAMPALHPSDGGLLVGQMAPWTANAGAWYPPAGSLDAEDLKADGRFDLIGNMVREVGEELGLGLDAGAFEGDWVLYENVGRIALFGAARLDMDAEELLALGRAHLATEERPELSDLRVVADAAEAKALGCPPWVIAYLETVGG